MEIYRATIPKGLASLSIERGAGEIERAEDAVELARSANERMCPADAVILLKRALEIDPDCAPAVRELGETLVDMGHAEEGFAIYTEYLQRRPDASEIRLSYAGSRLRAGDVDAAIDAYRRCIQSRPGWEDPHAPLVRALLRAGRLVEASTALTAYRPIAADVRIVATLEQMVAKAR